MQITKKKFIEMYNSNSLKEMSKKLGVSTVTIWKWARKFDLPLKTNKRLIIDE